MNNIYVGAGSITYDNTTHDTRMGKYNHQSIERDIGKQKIKELS